MGLDQERIPSEAEFIIISCDARKYPIFEMLRKHLSQESQKPYLRSVSRFSFQNAIAPLDNIVNIVISIRHPDEFDSLNLLSASSKNALITLWTASWCPSCRTVAPLVREMIENDGVAEHLGGIGFAEIEFDSPTLGELASRYMINSIPTLLAFSRHEAQLQTRLTSVAEMKDREFLRLWIENEARRGGSGGMGGTGFLGGMFGVGGRS